MTASMSGSVSSSGSSPRTGADGAPSVDLAVVGGGLAGLVAATTAARQHLRVVLLDSRAVGGRARSSDRRGFRFNQGAHALYDRGEARPILLDLGVELRGATPNVRHGGLWYRDRMHLLPDGPVALLRTTALSARSKLVTAKLLARVQSFDAPAQGHLSFGEWLDRRRLPADVRDVVLAITRVGTYAHSPAELSADAALSQLQRALIGVTYLDHGWQGLVDQLTTIATGAGVDIREHASVTSLTQPVGGAGGGRGGGGGGSGQDPWTVTTGHDSFTAANVVVAGLGPHEAAGLLGATPDELGWGGLGPDQRASCLDLGVSRPATRRVLFGVDEPLYLSTHTPPSDLVSPEIARAGGGVVQLLRYLDADEAPDPDVTRAELVRHARHVGLDPSGPADHLGSPGAGSREGGAGGSGVVEQRYLHRMTVAHGMPIAANGGLAGRPPVTVAGRSGLFVAGDWVGPVGMLADAAVASARAAATAAVTAGRRSAAVAP
jgi:phytoene dehydrogenase-like protein